MYKSGKWYRFRLNKKIDSDFPTDIKFAGNYVIFAMGKCLYIGQSNNIKRRLKDHIRLSYHSSLWQTPWGAYKELVIAIRPEKFRYERMAIEARLIYKINPEFNGLSPGQQLSKRRKFYNEMVQTFS